MACILTIMCLAVSRRRTDHLLTQNSFRCPDWWHHTQPKRKDTTWDILGRAEQAPFGLSERGAKRLQILLWLMFQWLLELGFLHGVGIDMVCIAPCIKRQSNGVFLSDCPDALYPDMGQVEKGEKWGPKAVGSKTSKMEPDTSSLTESSFLCRTDKFLIDKSKCLQSSLFLQAMLLCGK